MLLADVICKIPMVRRRRISIRIAFIHIYNDGTFHIA